MLEKHLKRIKKSESGNPEEDEWTEASTLGERLPQQIMEDVLDRSIIIERKKTDNIKKYEKDAPRLKDQFKNTAQYVKLVKKHLADKQTNFAKFKEEKKEFDKQIATLKPKPRHTFDLSKLNFKENKVEILKKEIEILTEDREEIKKKISHFKSQLDHAQLELNFKVEQIEDVYLELQRLEKKEILKNKIKTEDEALEIIKKELIYIGDVEQTRKVYGTINTLVDLLKSKNMLTQNELKQIKNEFQILKQKYEKLMSQLR